MLDVLGTIRTTYVSLWAEVEIECCPMACLCCGCSPCFTTSGLPMKTGPPKQYAAAQTRHNLTGRSSRCEIFLCCAVEQSYSYRSYRLSPFVLWNHLFHSAANTIWPQKALSASQSADSHDAPVPVSNLFLFTFHPAGEEAAKHLDPCE